MDKEKFLEIIRQIASRDTSANPENWTAENPLWGHCAVVSLLAQDYFGGELMRAPLVDFPKYSYLKSHYWNKLEDGAEIDFTAGQYAEKLNLKNTEMRQRERVLAYPDTQRRYKLLVARFNNIKNNLIL